MPLPSNGDLLGTLCASLCSSVLLAATCFCCWFLETSLLLSFGITSCLALHVI